MIASLRAVSSRSSGAFATLLESHTAVCDAPLRVARCGEMGLGLVALRDVRAGEELLRLPPQLWWPVSAEV